MKQIWGKLTSVDLKSCDPELIRSEDAIRFFVDQLVNLLKMKKFGETTIVNFGEDPKVSGFSMTQLIETSLISGHFANQTNNVYLDIFSCGEYDCNEAAEFAKDYFRAEDMEFNTLERYD